MPANNQLVMVGVADSSLQVDLWPKLIGCGAFYLFVLWVYVCIKALICIILLKKFDACFLVCIFVVGTSAVGLDRF